MKKSSFTSLLLLTVMIFGTSMNAMASARTDKLISQDTTERLENISELKSNIRSLKLQISTLQIALVEAKKHKSKKKIYVNTKKVADALTAITILGGALGSYYFENKINVLKIASLIGGLSTSVSVITGLLADMSSDEAEAVTNKISDITPILKATQVNLVSEINLLCNQEPSNQMCR
ncbi:MAG: hypothetical protein H7336_01435 [Bacteriovorax sp.]|nr:hypothetical protein [Bacteriovorax sp.]